jgi:DNA-binding XRE family transcriptional regulator
MSIIEKLASAEAEVQRLKTLAETYGKVEAVVREAGHKSLDEFLKEVGIAEKAVPPAAEKKEGKGKAGPPAKRKRKRVTITAELAAEMKSSREIEKLSQEKTAKKLGVSLSSVVNWEKKKFVFPKK